MIAKPDKTAGQEKFEQFRKEYTFLEYSGFETKIDDAGLQVSYEFSLAGKYIFRPHFSIPKRKYFPNFPTTDSIKDPIFQNLIFHIGLIELISYWKCACPPLIIIKGQKLSDEQVSWWKNVYYQGLGEFFYTNGIKSSVKKFMSITSDGSTTQLQKLDLDETVIVPVGGGKDSVVTLELLGQTAKVRPFIMNPRGATLECVRVAGFGNQGFIEVNRRLDPLLLDLNSKGFLNGHTPFSALLAFYSLLVSAVSGHRNIALSNESSANEPTVAGTDVNHQYSKSYAFESDFRDYTRKYISPDFNYFSFLRPLNELQIARLFSEQVKYYPVFKSCNAGSKTDIWCCNCPKCLFAFTILNPFIPLIELVHIFGKNLFEMPQMLGYLKELTGIEEVKPFECVGTIDEVNAALQLFISKHKNEKLPLLIDYYSNTTNFSTYNLIRAETTLNEFNHDHFLESRFLQTIKQKLQ
jgi:UDP-N-acetyl-alpha-D-muramoyl-L-alanyl-L-glutamate epimerase